MTVLRLPWGTYYRLLGRQGLKQMHLTKARPMDQRETLVCTPKLKTGVHYGNNAYREKDNTRVYNRSLKIY